MVNVTPYYLGKSRSSSCAGIPFTTFMNRQVMNLGISYPNVTHRASNTYYLDGVTLSVTNVTQRDFPTRCHRHSLQVKQNHSGRVAQKAKLMVLTMGPATSDEVSDGQERYTGGGMCFVLYRDCPL